MLSHSMWSLAAGVGPPVATPVCRWCWAPCGYARLGVGPAVATPPWCWAPCGYARLPWCWAPCGYARLGAGPLWPHRPLVLGPLWLRPAADGVGPPVATPGTLWQHAVRSAYPAWGHAAGAVAREPAGRDLGEGLYAYIYLCPVFAVHGPCSGAAARTAHGSPLPSLRSRCLGSGPPDAVACAYAGGRVSPCHLLSRRPLLRSVVRSGHSYRRVARILTPVGPRRWGREVTHAARLLAVAGPRRTLEVHAAAP